MQLGITSCFVRKLLIYLCTSFYFLVAEGTALRSKTRLKVCICTRECWFGAFGSLGFFWFGLLFFSLLGIQVSGFCQKMPNSCLFLWRIKNYSSYGSFIPCFPKTDEDGMRILSSLLGLRTNSL